MTTRRVRTQGAGLFDSPSDDLDPAALAPAPGAGQLVQPLAERMRPRTLEECVGQAAWLGPDGFLTRALQAPRPPSLILWGPPGAGKTTLARLVARAGRATLVPVSAVQDGVARLREIVGEAAQRGVHGRPTVVFVDEIHRFHKGQQDFLLPHVESGAVALVGATTENPSFALTSALLSRCAVVVLDPLAPADLVTLLERALTEARGLGGLGLTADAAALATIAREADGDARRALTALEVAAEAVLHAAATEPTAAPHLDLATLARLPLHQAPRHDRQGEQHHEVISAFIKSLRGSDPDAALYWLARMLASGEDPRFICRRLVVFAAEDVSNADPLALPLAVAAMQSHEFTGLPESRIAMAHATTYLATAPKSKASYLGLVAATAAVHSSGTLPVPLHLRNATTRLAADLGWGADYEDPHAAGGWVPATYLPDALAGQTFYTPTRNGHEARIADRVATWRKLRDDAARGSGGNPQPSDWVGP
ncbi:MAG: replication-associated recombination protein A [Myxococcales bacterium]|nr:replication-associated recombination protein A [Myxococcales bacterium]